MSHHSMASNAGEAIERMLVEKKISSKINYDVLKDLADGFTTITRESTDSNSLSQLQSDPFMHQGEPEAKNSSLPPITRTPLVARGRLPSLSARKRTFSSLEVSSGQGMEPK